MDLVKGIEELLYYHECVTIPDFGSFLVSNTSAKVDFKTGKFVSPKRKISFNALIKQNDGILAKYISSNKNISYQNWIPSREGNIIFIDTIENCQYNFGIKLTLNYQDNEIKKQVLSEYFN